MNVDNSAAIATSQPTTTADSTALPVMPTDVFKLKCGVCCCCCIILFHVGGNLIWQTPPTSLKRAYIYLTIYMCGLYIKYVHFYIINTIYLCVS